MHGDRISHQSIWKHMNEHFNVRAEALEQYEKSQVLMKKAVNEQLAEVDMLDELARTNYELHMAAQAWADAVVRRQGRLPGTLVKLLAVTAGETRQQIKQKLELLGKDPENKKSDAIHTLLDALLADDEDDEE